MCIRDSNYFIDNPQVYATTVGLYNDSNDLLAVAKLSKPLVKDFTKEALVRVKLDFYNEWGRSNNSIRKILLYLHLR